MKKRLIPVLLITLIAINAVLTGVQLYYIHALNYYIGITEQQNAILRNIIGRQVGTPGDHSPAAPKDNY